MLRVAVGVEIADRHRLNLVVFQLGDGAVKRDAVEPDLDAAVCAHALANPEAPCARHQRLRRRHAQIIAIVLKPFAHFEDIAVSLGGEQPNLGSLVFKQSVSGYRRAVDDTLGLGEKREAVELQRLSEDVQPLHHTDRWILRS